MAIIAAIAMPIAPVSRTGLEDGGAQGRRRTRMARRVRWRRTDTRAARSAPRVSDERDRACTCCRAKCDEALPHRRPRENNGRDPLYPAAAAMARHAGAGGAEYEVDVDWLTGRVAIRIDATPQSY
jgi:hypothetical protein